MAGFAVGALAATAATASPYYGGYGYGGGYGYNSYGYAPVTYGYSAAPVAYGSYGSYADDCYRGRGSIYSSGLYDGFYSGY